MIWQTVPRLRLSTDSIEVVNELSKTLMITTQNQLNSLLAPMKTFIETFPSIIEKLPESLSKDVKEEFQETREKLETEFKLLRESTPTFKETAETVQTMTNSINQVTERQMDSIKKELTEKVKEVLSGMGFPQPEQMKLLTQLMPATLPLLEELLRFQKVPADKGKQGEIELIKQLRDYYPEDDCTSIGGPGDTDIISTPRVNCSNLPYKIIIESKRNGSGWNRSFIQQTRKHMQIRGERFAILAVENMPKGANGFLLEQCPEGVLLVTDREYFRVAYGSLRASMIALQPFNRKEIDFNKLFADQKINEAIKEAYNYCTWVKKIKEKARRIETNAEDIQQDTDDLDKQLRRALNELQSRINNAIAKIDSEEFEKSLTQQRSLEVTLNG